MTLHGQHYTTKEVSEAVVATLSAQAPALVVDIGAGLGSLALAATERFQQAQLVTVEIDRKNHRHLKEVLPHAEHLHQSAFAVDLPTRMGYPANHADIAVCNPPFLTVKGDKPRKILAAAGMPGDWSEHIAQRAETLFLAQNLRMLKSGGELAIILPDAYANGHHFQPFRHWLLERHQVISVIRLPTSSFTDAEVNTVAITLRTGGVTRSFPVFDVLNGETVRLDEVGQAAAVRRILAPRYESATESPFVGLLKLADLKAEVCRGTPVSELEALGVPYFHTTDFKHHGPKLYWGKSGETHGSIRLAQRGDVLLGRVGRNCHLQSAVVVRGSMPISDCIYRVRVPNAVHASVVHSLLSPEGSAWRGSRVHGAAASLISKMDLLEHPIFINR